MIFLILATALQVSAPGPLISNEQLVGTDRGAIAVRDLIEVVGPASVRVGQCANRLDPDTQELWTHRIGDASVLSRLPEFRDDLLMMATTYYVSGRVAVGNDGPTSQDCEHRLASETGVVERALAVFGQQIASLPVDASR